ncbi:MAG: recombinase family protein [Alphaproteobacteria bacterium]|nr:recombinase family protein [Alphaproteobacteria bacterium]
MHLTQNQNQDIATIRAAMYVRMSTEHQQYSTANQEDAIRAYAAQHHMEIVKVYADDGKSGLKIRWRKGLQQLIDDVENRRTNYDAVLVYDISRWGRFQDADTAAHYEFLCRDAGVAKEQSGNIQETEAGAPQRFSAGLYLASKDPRR